MFGGRQRRFEAGHLFVQRAAHRGHRRFVRLILEVALPVDLFFLGLVGFNLRRWRFLGARGARVTLLEPLLEYGVFEQFLLHELAQLHA